MTGLSKRTKVVIQRMFPTQQQDDVEQFLTEECSANLLFLENTNEIELERIRFAVLKLSGGDLNQLLRNIQGAQTDWRDVLMAAGFGYDIAVHDAWVKSYLAATESV